MSTRQLLAVSGLEKTSNEFRRELILMCERVGLVPDYVTSVIAFETGKTFSPSIVNPQSGAVGLIQFLPSTARTLGTTAEALKAMSATAQLKYVEAYFSHFGSLPTLEATYLAVFAGRGASSPDTVLFETPSKAYEQNKGLDGNHDGIITAGEATSRVRAIYEAAKARPPIIVDMNAPSSGGPPNAASGATVAVFLLAVWGVYRWSSTTRKVL